MLFAYTIKDLYALALGEGEGMGTAYEYYAKRLVLGPWLRDLGTTRSVLIAGLPERYGLSLDFLLLGTELGATVTIADNRPESLEALLEAREQLVSSGMFQLAEPQTVLARDFAQLEEAGTDYDLALSSEVLQRLAPPDRRPFVENVARRSRAFAIFAPNGDNPAHTSRSGLSGLRLEELRSLADHMSAKTGYIDMPPFPPGITRSDEQREHATTGAFEQMVMWGLGHYARREHWFPAGVRERQSHIVYALNAA